MIKTDHEILRGEKTEVGYSLNKIFFAGCLFANGYDILSSRAVLDISGE